jgi:hypothetical protein
MPANKAVPCNPCCPSFETSNNLEMSHRSSGTIVNLDCSICVVIHNDYATQRFMVFYIDGCIVLAESVTWLSYPSSRTRNNIFDHFTRGGIRRTKVSLHACTTVQHTKCRPVGEEQGNYIQHP